MFDFPSEKVLALEDQELVRLEELIRSVCNVIKRSTKDWNNRHEVKF
jgi:hypothetical protein